MTLTQHMTGRHQEYFSKPYVMMTSILLRVHEQGLTGQPLADFMVMHMPDWRMVLPVTDHSPHDKYRYIAES